jgi:hypothetical protein
MVPVPLRRRSDEQSRGRASSVLSNGTARRGRRRSAAAAAGRGKLPVVRNILLLQGRKDIPVRGPGSGSAQACGEEESGYRFSGKGALRRAVRSAVIHAQADAQGVLEVRRVGGSFSTGGVTSDGGALSGDASESAGGGTTGTTSAVRQSMWHFRSVPLGGGTEYPRVVPRETPSPLFEALTCAAYICEYEVVE